MFATLGGSKDTFAPSPGTVIERPKRPTFNVPGRGYYIARGPLTSALDTVYGVVSHFQ